MKKLDIWVVIALTGLCSFGLFNIFGIKRELFGNQMVFSLLGFSSLFLFLKIGTDFFRLNSRIIYSLFIVLLLVTFFFGENIRGSQRWINVFFFNFQPSEFLKPFFVILLADLFASKASLLKKMCLSFVIFIVPFSQENANLSLVPGQLMKIFSLAFHYFHCFIFVSLL